MDCVDWRLAGAEHWQEIIIDTYLAQLGTDNFCDTFNHFMVERDHQTHSTFIECHFQITDTEAHYLSVP